MKVIIFAGGAGKRFWPIGREDRPKQFIPLVNGKSTFELMIERIQPVYGWHSIYVSTNEKYVTEVKRLCPQISISNIFTEPARRDVGPAVGLSLVRLRKMGVKEPVAILWADHLIEKVENFQEILKHAEDIILRQKYKAVLVGETPTFANSNIGWISIGKNIEKNYFEFKDFVYRPSEQKCKEIFKTKKALWNTAYLISTVDYLLGFYEKYFPNLYKDLCIIEKALDTPKEAEVIQKIYPKIKSVHFDHIVAYNLEPKQTVVVKSNMGWVDPGTLFALKKYLEPSDKNAELGLTFSLDTKDSLIFNYEDNKILATIGLDKMIVVNTLDAILVVPANRVRDISELFKMLKEDKKFKRFIKSNKRRSER